MARAWKTLTIEKEEECVFVSVECVNLSYLNRFLHGLFGSKICKGKTKHKLLNLPFI